MVATICIIDVNECSKYRILNTEIFEEEYHASVNFYSLHRVHHYYDEDF